MPAVDLAAIREKHAAWLNQRLLVSELVRDEAPDAEIAAAEQVLLRLSDTTLLHLPALLARVEALEAALLRADKRADACAMALGDCGNRLAAMTRDRDQWRDVAEARDAALKAAASGDCPVGGCGGSTVELHAYERAEPVAVVLDCGHDTAGGEKAAESPADPPAPLSPGTPREAV